MTSFHIRKAEEVLDNKRRDSGVQVGATASFEEMMDWKANMMERLQALGLTELTVQKATHITHYSCPTCKLQPLFLLNLEHHNKVRCRKCGHLIPFPGRGKYGKIKKKLALATWEEMKENRQGGDRYLPK
jgi:DNA-directed RNA polymerase subunit RPC12/RpoP